MPSARSVEVVAAFQQYVKTGNKCFVKTFTANEIELALLQHSNVLAKDLPYFKAMEVRREELNQEENERAQCIKVWKERVVGIVIGVVVTLIANFLWKLISE